MSDRQIETAYTQEYSTNIAILSQQIKSKFRDAVMSDTYTGEGAKVVDQFGSVTAQRRDKAHGEIVVNETPQQARWVHPEDYDTGDIIDKEDRLRTLIKPDSAMMKVHVAAVNVTGVDKEIIDAFFGDAKTGKKGTDTTSFDSNNIINANVGAAADTGMNVKKLLTARRLVLANEVDLDMPDNQLFCGISAQEEEALIDQIKVGSKDYRDKAVFDDPSSYAGLKSFFGINFIISERFKSSGANRLCPFWVKSGMHLGIWKDVTGEVWQLTERRRKPWYVTAYGTIGATRVEEAKVFQILCKK